MLGEATYDRFFLIRNDPFPSIPVPDVPQVKQCCSDNLLMALADTSNPDPLRNDVYGPIWQLPTVASAATLTLIKNDTDIVNLTDGKKLSDGSSVNMGDLYDFAFFTNINGNPFVGYQLKWRNVLSEFGPGKYKISMTCELSFGGLIKTFYTPSFCLYPYADYLADGTIRIEYWNSGINGHPDFDDQIIDMGTDMNWYNSYRLNGWFGFEQPKYEGEYVQYESGERKYVTHTMEPEFELQLMHVPYFIHKIMRTEVMMADRIEITDYNGFNINNYISKGVYDGTYETEYYKMQTKTASAQAKFKQRTNNFRKQRM